MKKGIIALIVAGGVLTTAGAVMFGIGLANEINHEKLVTHTYELKESITMFDIDINTADLEFIPLESGNARVVLEEKEKEYHTVKEEQGTLFIKGYDTKNWYERLFTFGYKKMSVKLYVPAEAYSRLVIDISSGDVNIPKDYIFDNTEIKGSTGNINYAATSLSGLSITTSTGDINVTTPSANTINLKASTGNINVSKSSSTALQLEASTGRISLDDVQSGDCNIVTSTGDIKLNKTLLTGKLTTSCSTGSVKLTESDASEVDIKTSTGDVTCEFLTSKIVYPETSTGSIRVPHATEGGLCTIKTSTGDIVVTIKG